MEDNAVNPLLNPLVITEVYKYLRFNDKKNFRLVCKLWIDTILQLWRKQTKLVIKHEKFTQDGRRNSRPQTADFILEYFNLYKIAEKQLLNLKLSNLEFSFLPEDFLESKQNYRKIARLLQSQNVQNFLAIYCGDSLERLEIEDCSFLQQGRFEAGFYHILLNCFPKLKVLSVRQPQISPSFGHKLVLNESSFQRTQSDLVTLNIDGKGLKHETITRIFNLIPNLKDLSLRGPACAILKALPYIYSSSGSHILLEKLGIDDDDDTEILMEFPAWIQNYLEAARPPLKCLKASLPFGKFPPGWVEFPEEPSFIYKPIWNCVGNTLTSINLRILSGMWSWCTLFTGCFLPKLTNLRLNFREINDKAVECLFFDFGMLRGTPLLKRVHLVFEMIFGSRFQAVGTNLEEHELEWGGNAGKELQGPIVLEHMEEFRFELYHKPTEGCWRAFAKMMPNLRKLESLVDENTEPLVRQLWPHLNLAFSDLLRPRGDLTGQNVSFGNFWDETDWEDWQGSHLSY